MFTSGSRSFSFFSKRPLAGRHVAIISSFDVIFKVMSQRNNKSKLLNYKNNHACTCYYHTIPLVIEHHLIYCIYPSFKLMVYSKNYPSLTYSHVFWNLYDFVFSIEHKRTYSRMSKLLFSIQWKWIVTAKLFSEQWLRLQSVPHTKLTYDYF